MFEDVQPEKRNSITRNSPASQLVHRTGLETLNGPTMYESVPFGEGLHNGRKMRAGGVSSVAPKMVKGFCTGRYKNYRNLRYRIIHAPFFKDDRRSPKLGSRNFDESTQPTQKSKPKKILAGRSAAKWPEPTNPSIATIDHAFILDTPVSSTIDDGTAPFVTQVWGTDMSES